MGEEEKKPEEAKKPGKVKNKEEAPKAEEKPSDEKKSEESKEPPPPPQEIILQVYMHCEGCARKVRRCLKGFEGVEEVTTDCKTSKVIVKGEKADPIKVWERVQRKSHRQVELISPIPKPPPQEEPENPEKKEVPKAEEKKPEPQVISVILQVYMHCEACAQEIKRRIQRMKGVESAEPDIKSSQVTVKGVFQPENLVDYVYKRTGKHAVIMKVKLEKKEADGKEQDKDVKEEKKAEAEGEKEAKKGGEEGNKENKEGAPADAASAAPTSDKDGGGEEAPAKPEAQPEVETKLEMKKNEFYYYYPQNYQIQPQRFVHEDYGYPPQIFSDENPNACSVM